VKSRTYLSYLSFDSHSLFNNPIVKIALHDKELGETKNLRNQEVKRECSHLVEIQTGQSTTDNDLLLLEAVMANGKKEKKRKTTTRRRPEQERRMVYR